MEHVSCRAVSSQEDHHWETLLNEDKIEEAEIDKHRSAETNSQLSENPKIKT